MRKIRIGNDFWQSFQIKEKGVIVDLLQVKDTVQVFAKVGDKCFEVPKEMVQIKEDGIITMEVKTELFNVVGRYEVIVKYWHHDISMSDGDRKQAVNFSAFTIVSTSEMADDLEDVPIVGDIIIGLKGDPFTYDDFTPEQIEDLKRPAIEGGEYAREQGETAKTQGELAETQGNVAQAQGDYALEQGSYAKTQGELAETVIATEEVRVVAEQSRVAAETNRVSAEQSRVNAESDRVTAESNRVSAESDRAIADLAREELYSQTESLKTETETAKDSAISAATLANDKADYAQDQGDYAKTQADIIADGALKLTNDVVNGDFRNGVTGWINDGDSPIENNRVYISTKVAPLFRQPINFTVGDTYYLGLMGFADNTDAVGLTWALGNGGSYKAPLIYIDKEHTTLRKYGAVFKIADATINGILASRRGIATTGVFISTNFMIFNLTQTFGAGNEPTKAEMDELIKLLPNGYFEGELSLTQKQIAIWQLNLIRQNRNAIVALGGTII